MTLILIAEDNIMIGMMLEADLQRAGYEVAGPFIRSGQALAAAAERVPDLALLDIDLAGGDDGVALARDLREAHGVPSLFVTGQLAVAQKHGDSAALGALIKPFGSALLLETVEAALAYARAGDAPAESRGRVWF